MLETCGTLLRIPFFLDVPRHLMDMMPLPNPKTRWFMNAAEAGATLGKFAQWGVPESLIQSILQPANRTQFGNLIVFFPPPAEVVALDPSVRAAVYEELRRFPHNDEIASPLVFTGGEDVLGWFAGTNLRPELVRLIERLAYPRQGALAFSDASLVMGQTRGESEARQVMAALLRTRSLLLKVAIDPDSDAAAIGSHWARGPADRGWEITSLLASWCDTHTASSFDATHLLPKIPRMLLYTFPNLSMTLDGALPDAHWTSLNFFSTQPGPVFLDPALGAAAITEEMDPVDPPYQFGDILAFQGGHERRKTYHSCVYVADDIVFTKNGSKPTAPWVLQEWSDLKKIQLGGARDSIQGYRRRTEPAR